MLLFWFGRRLNRNPIKQAPGYIKVLGEGYVLDAGRMTIESEVMQEYAATAPEYVPRFIFRDTEHFVLVTEFLNGYVLVSWVGFEPRSVLVQNSRSKSPAQKSSHVEISQVVVLPEAHPTRCRCAAL